MMESDDPTRPLRVLHVLACDDFAGAELLVASYVERFDRSRVHAELATLAPPGPIAARLRRAGIATHSLGGRGRLVAVLRLARLLSRGYDVVNAHGFKVTMYARLARLVSRRAALISSVHGLHVTEVEEPTQAKGRVAMALERVGSRLIDVYEVNTEGAIGFLAAHGIPRQKMTFIPNAIDLAEWPPPSRARRNNDRVPTVVCVARFVPRKRHEDLLRGLGRLATEGVAFRAVLPGYGPTLEPMRVLADELGIDAAFPGRLAPADVRTVLATADIFCLPTLWEGTVISVMEAMAMELPVVATDVNGVNEVVEDRVTGFLVPPYRDDLLADALRRLLSDPELAHEMGRAGRERVEREFRLDGIVRAKEELYAGLVARGRAD